MNYYELEDEENRKLMGLPPLARAAEFRSLRGGLDAVMAHIIRQGPYRPKRALDMAVDYIKDPAPTDAEILRSLGIEP